MWSTVWLKARQAYLAVAHKQPVLHAGTGSSYSLFVLRWFGVILFAGNDIGIQGNLDPAILHGDHATIKVHKLSMEAGMEP